MLHRLSLSMQFAALDQAEQHRKALPRHKVIRWIRHALENDAQITVRIVDAAEGRALNRDYRQQNYATNVLTFGYGDKPLRADIVLCAPVIAREARANRKGLQPHYAHLIVHGTLHAQGWDHETSPEDAEAMEAQETRILEGLGFRDPYA